MRRIPLAAKVLAAIALAITVAIGGTLSTVAWASSPSAASKAQLKQMSGTVTYPVNLATAWSWTHSAEWVCGLVPSCAESKDFSTAKRSHYRLTINIAAPVVGQVSSADVDVVVTKRVPGKSLNLTMTMDHALGTFKSKATVMLKAKGKNSTKVKYKTLSAKGTGAAGNLALSEMASSTKSQLQLSLSNYLVTAASQPPMRVDVTAKPVKKGSAKNKVTATVAVLSYPAGYAVPTASGTLRVYVGGKLRCTTTVSASTGNCKVKLPRNKTQVITTINGELSSGLPLLIGSVKNLKAKGVR